MIAPPQRLIVIVFEKERGKAEVDGAASIEETTPVGARLFKSSSTLTAGVNSGMLELGWRGVACASPPPVSIDLDEFCIGITGGLLVDDAALERFRSRENSKE